MRPEASEAWKEEGTEAGKVAGGGGSSEAKGLGPEGLLLIRSFFPTSRRRGAPPRPAPPPRPPRLPPRVKPSPPTSIPGPERPRPSVLSASAWPACEGAVPPASSAPPPLLGLPVSSRRRGGVGRRSKAGLPGVEKWKCTGVGGTVGAARAGDGCTGGWSPPWEGEGEGVAPDAPTLQELRSGWAAGPEVVDEDGMGRGALATCDACSSAPTPCPSLSPSAPPLAAAFPPSALSLPSGPELVKTDPESGRGFREAATVWSRGGLPPAWRDTGEGGES